MAEKVFKAKIVPVLDRAALQSVERELEERFKRIVARVSPLGGGGGGHGPSGGPGGSGPSGGSLASIGGLSQPIPGGRTSDGSEPFGKSGGGTPPGMPPIIPSLVMSALTPRPPAPPAPPPPPPPQVPVSQPMTARTAPPAQSSREHWPTTHSLGTKLASTLNVSARTGQRFIESLAADTLPKGAQSIRLNEQGHRVLSPHHATTLRKAVATLAGAGVPEKVTSSLSPIQAATMALAVNPQIPEERQQQFIDAFKRQAKSVSGETQKLSRNQIPEVIKLVKEKSRFEGKEKLRSPSTQVANMQRLIGEHSADTKFFSGPDVFGALRNMGGIAKTAWSYLSRKKDVPRFPALNPAVTAGTQAGERQISDVGPLPTAAKTSSETTPSYPKMDTSIADSGQHRGVIEGVRPGVTERTVSKEEQARRIEEASRRVPIRSGDPEAVQVRKPIPLENVKFSTRDFIYPGQRNRRFTTQEAANLLGTSVERVRTAARNLQIEKFGGTYSLRRDDVAKIESREPSREFPIDYKEVARSSTESRQIPLQDSPVQGEATSRVQRTQQRYSRSRGSVINPFSVLGDAWGGISEAFGYAGGKIGGAWERLRRGPFSASLPPSPEIDREAVGQETEEAVTRARQNLPDDFKNKHLAEIQSLQPPQISALDTRKDIQAAYKQYQRALGKLVTATIHDATSTENLIQRRAKLEELYKSLPEKASAFTKSRVQRAVIKATEQAEQGAYKDEQSIVDSGRDSAIESSTNAASGFAKAQADLDIELAKDPGKRDVRRIKELNRQIARHRRAGRPSGVGLFMNVLFGGWEVGQASRAAMRAYASQIGGTTEGAIAAAGEAEAMLAGPMGSLIDIASLGSFSSSAMFSRATAESAMMRRTYGDKRVDLAQSMSLQAAAQNARGTGLAEVAIARKAAERQRTIVGRQMQEEFAQVNAKAAEAEYIGKYNAGRELAAWLTQGYVDDNYAANVSDISEGVSRRAKNERRFIAQQNRKADEQSQKEFDRAYRESMRSSSLSTSIGTLYNESVEQSFASQNPMLSDVARMRMSQESRLSSLPQAADVIRSREALESAKRRKERGLRGYDAQYDTRDTDYAAVQNEASRRARREEFSETIYQRKLALVLANSPEDVRNKKRLLTRAEAIEIQKHIAPIFKELEKQRVDFDKANPIDRRAASILGDTELMQKVVNRQKIVVSSDAEIKAAELQLETAKKSMTGADKLLDAQLAYAEALRKASNITASTQAAATASMSPLGRSLIMNRGHLAAQLATIDATQDPEEAARLKQNAGAQMRALIEQNDNIFKLNAEQQSVALMRMRDPVGAASKSSDLFFQQVMREQFPIERLVADPAGSIKHAFANVAPMLERFREQQRIEAEASMTQLRNSARSTEFNEIGSTRDSYKSRRESIYAEFDPAISLAGGPETPRGAQLRRMKASRIRSTYKMEFLENAYYASTAAQAAYSAEGKTMHASAEGLVGQFQRNYSIAGNEAQRRLTRETYLSRLDSMFKEGGGAVLSNPNFGGVRWSTEDETGLEAKTRERINNYTEPTQDSFKEMIDVSRDTLKHLEAISSVLTGQ